MNILCYGDSNTYGYDPTDGMRYPEEIRWPGVLRRLRPGDTVIEEGCNGRTCAFTPADEPWKDGRSYLKACLNSHKPLDLVILMLGSNDLKRVFHASPEDIAAGIRQILGTTRDFLAEKQGFSPRLLLIAPPVLGEGIASSPASDGFDYDAIDRSRHLAPLFKAEAEAFVEAGGGVCDFLDASDLIRTSEIDSLHLMPKAHEALARAIHQRIDRLPDSALTT